jgi:hypothetical protein
MKRLLISFALGIVSISVLLVSILLTYKILFPGSTTGLVWLFAWPVWIFRWLFPSASSNSLVLSALCVALATEISTATLVIFAMWNLIDRWRRKGQNTQLPPKPPTYEIE